MSDLSQAQPAAYRFLVMPSVFTVFIVICSGLAFVICLRELVFEVTRDPEARAEAGAFDQVSRKMGTLDFKITDRISDEWLDRLVLQTAASERVGRTRARFDLGRADYIVVLLALAIVAFGGLVAGFAQLGS